MKILRKYWLFFVILFVGVFFRLINLDKVSGLWYDEMTIYSIALNFNADIHRFLLFPLYYIIYHVWIGLFGNSDLVIRSMSVFFDILGIISSYFVGRQIGVNINIDKRKAAIFYMLLYSINSSFIYYAQEAKFYSITFFVVNILMFGWLKFIRNPNNKNFLLYYLSSIILILTYTSQCLLVMILYFVTIIYNCRYKNIDLKKLFIYLTVFLPVLVFLVKVPGYFSGNFDAVVYDNSFFILMLQNWFSPLLSGLQNNILNYHLYTFMHLLNIKFLLFILFPIIYLCCAIFKGIKNYKLLMYMSLIPLIYIVLHINYTVSSSGYRVLVRYTLPVLPIVLMIAAVGFCRFKNKILIGLFVIINLLGIISINGAPKIARPEGYRVLADILRQNNILPQYDFILPIRTGLLDKYFYIVGNRFSLYVLNNPEVLQTYLTQDEIKKLSVENLKAEAYKRFLTEDTITPEFEEYILNNFVSNNKLVILKDTSICMFSNEQLKIIAQSENYRKYPLQFLRLSKLNNDMLTVLSRHMKLSGKFSYGNWEIFVFAI